MKTVGVLFLHCGEAGVANEAGGVEALCEVSLAITDF